MLKKVSDINIFQIKSFTDKRGVLSVANVGQEIPFEIKRFFYISGMEEKTTRGQHAHKVCNQYMIALRGTVKIKCFDGVDIKVFELSQAQTGLLVPYSIWAEELYETKDALLLVLADQAYDPDDYLHDYGEYMNYRKSFP